MRAPALPMPCPGLRRIRAPAPPPRSPSPRRGFAMPSSPCQGTQKGRGARLSPISAAAHFMAPLPKTQGVRGLGLAPNPRQRAPWPPSPQNRRPQAVRVFVFLAGGAKPSFFRRLRRCPPFPASARREPLPSPGKAGPARLWAPAPARSAPIFYPCPVPSSLRRPLRLPRGGSGPLSPGGKQTRARAKERRRESSRRHSFSSCGAIRASFSAGGARRTRRWSQRCPAGLSGSLSWPAHTPAAAPPARHAPRR